MDGMVPQNKNIFDVINQIIADRMQGDQGLSDIPLKGNPEQAVSSVAATGKPHTQKKVPKEMMDKMLKQRIYELDPDSQLNLNDINDIDTAVYRSR